MANLNLNQLGLLKPRGDSLPVDNIPDSLEIFSLAVLVLEIVGMLPSIDAQQRDVLAGHWILVGTGCDTKGTALLILDEPSPTAALDTGKSGVELLAEGIEGAKVLVDRFLLTTLLSHDSCT